MKEFDEIRRGLLDLGWSEKPSKGDHTIFVKEGYHNITVSRALNDKGRSYKNCISNIRKQEPSFSVGKQPCHIEKATKETAPTEPPLPQYAFIKPEAIVRYSLPNMYDYSKLDNPKSLMNREYIVEAIANENGVSKESVTRMDDIITISDGEQEINTNPDTLDAWELKTCKSCGKKEPVNRNVIIDENGLCSKCSGEYRKLYSIFEQLHNEIKKDIPPHEKHYPGILGDLEYLFASDFRNSIRQYEGRDFYDIPLEALRAMSLRVVETSTTIMREIKKAKQAEQKKAAKKPFLYDLWSQYKKVLTSEYAIYLKSKGEAERKAFEKAQIIFEKVKYETRPSGEYTELTIVTDEKTAAYMIFLSRQFLTYFLDELTARYMIRLICPSAEFDQYITTSCNVDIREFLAPDGKYAEDSRFEIYRHYESVGFNALTQVGNKIIDVLEKDLQLPENQKDITLTCEMVYMDRDGKPGELSTLDVFKQEDYQPRYVIGVHNSKLLDAVRDKMMTLAEITRKKGDNFQFFVLDQSKMEECYTSLCFDSHYIAQYSLYPLICKQPKITTSPMAITTDNPLDAVNPNSSNPAMKDFTTRELLKELKERGVTFDGISVPVIVRQAVSLDEI